ncbi:phosphoribosyl-AMP cyclohydrolase [Canibacter zhoujuaniae]|uniref:phosphoribosyl-AMP cyclohydrolase n=1 Tax=Canibacter zhoujuaniae TaxID=2708343 RepID=UPI00142365C1|nr:phosphoribosyl-AMP cyclohydrolase [Canibacter zhoujuaniae]
MDIAKIQFNEHGLVPAIVQDHESREVLMMAWMNKTALSRTLAEGRVTYWSRSRGELWRKGDTSGHKQFVKEIRYDCDGDTLLLLVEQLGAACHLGTRSCFETGSLPVLLCAETEGE